jgi:hypothetical protein
MRCNPPCVPARTCRMWHVGCGVVGAGVPRRGPAPWCRPAVRRATYLAPACPLPVGVLERVGHHGRCQHHGGAVKTPCRQRGRNAVNMNIGQDVMCPRWAYHWAYHWAYLLGLKKKKTQPVGLSLGLFICRSSTGLHESTHAALGRLVPHALSNCCHFFSYCCHFT